MDQLLITIPEVREVRLLAETYDETEFAAYVREVQRNYLEKIIGSELYLDLLTNTQTLTEGSLTLGIKYKITDYKDGDDFTNITDAENKTGSVFVADAQPATWTYRSSLQTTSSIYFNLLEGTQYTDDGILVNYRGSKIYLIYLFLYLYFKEGDLNYSNSGKKTYNVENTSDARTATNNSITSNHFANAQIYGKEIIKFLEDNSGSYPLYNSIGIDASANERMEFKVFGSNYSRGRIIT